LRLGGGNVEAANAAPSPQEIREWCIGNLQHCTVKNKLDEKKLKNLNKNKMVQLKARVQTAEIFSQITIHVECKWCWGGLLLVKISSLKPSHDIGTLDAAYPDLHSGEFQDLFVNSLTESWSFFLSTSLSLFCVSISLFSPSVFLFLFIFGSLCVYPAFYTYFTPLQLCFYLCRQIFPYRFILSLSWQ
jgi:hypothetical protein